MPAALLFALLALGGCRGMVFSALTTPDGETVERPGAEGEVDDQPIPLWEAPVEAGAVLAEVDLGSGSEGYATDQRTMELTTTWDARVRRATERLAFLLGLAFPVGISPRVVLAPLGDEGRDHVIRGDVQGGRRVPVIHVNIEPLAAGRSDPDRAVLRALAAGVYEDASLRGAETPRWVLEAVSAVAAGDLDRRLLRLRRDAEVHGAGTVGVDPDDARVAEATGAAALLVLMETGEPGALRRFFQFAAEGDPPDPMLARLLHDAHGQWAGTGRTLLQERLDEIDISPWHTLAAARVALREMGRAGMETVLPDTVPGEISAEITFLRARAAADEGAYAEARGLLATLGDDGAAMLGDPGGAAFLRVRAEHAPGGDPVRAAELERRFRRDYPQRARLALRTVAWADESTAEAPDLDAIARRVADLLERHQAGAARRLLDGLGERALAPELTDAQRGVSEAEASPRPAALEVGRRRVETWRRSPDAETEAAVRDTGAAAVGALVQALPPVAGPAREEVLELAAETGGPGRTIEALASIWNRRPSLVEVDLDALLAFAPLAAIRVWSEGFAGDAIARLGGDRLWTRLRLGLDPSWVRDHPDVLAALRSDAYPTRREAFDLVVEDGQATPELVARGLGDQAPLLRRRAAEVGGTAGFRALALRALEDEAWIVRQTACAAAAIALGVDAIDPLFVRFQSDSSTEVRLAATGALLGLAKERAALVEGLVPGLGAEDVRIQDALEARLPTLDKSWVTFAVMRALEAEAARDAPRDSYFSRLFRVMERTLGREVGWVPGMPVAEVRALVGRLPQRLIDLGVLEARAPGR